MSKVLKLTTKFLKTWHWWTGAWLYDAMTCYGMTWATGKAKQAPKEKPNEIDNYCRNSDYLAIQSPVLNVMTCYDMPIKNTVGTGGSYQGSTPTMDHLLWMTCRKLRFGLHQRDLNFFQWCGEFNLLGRSQSLMFPLLPLTSPMKYKRHCGIANSTLYPAQSKQTLKKPCAGYSKLGDCQPCHDSIQTLCQGADPWPVRPTWRKASICRSGPKNFRNASMLRSTTPDKLRFPNQKGLL